MLILAVVALILAGGVTIFAYQAISNRIRPAEDTSQIVVAALPLDVGSKLTERDLRVMPWPRAAHIEGSFDKISDVVGQAAIVSMIPNEPILKTKLGQPGLPIPDGMRAVGVKVNEVIGVAGFVVPGTRVDVILSGSPKEHGAIDVAKVILENVQVLTAGSNVTNDASGKPMNVQVVTLLVSPEQSEKLALANIDGRIQLALRNPEDLEHLNPLAMYREDLFKSDLATSPPKPVVSRNGGRFRPPVPPPVQPPVTPPVPPPPAEPFIWVWRDVDVYTGDKQQTVKVRMRVPNPAYQVTALNP